jgi:glutaredoxin
MRSPPPRIPSLLASALPAGRIALLALVGLVALAATACQRSVPAAPTVEPPLQQLEVLKDGRHLFTYVEPSGAFATTDKPEIIPEPSRKLVRVIDPGQTKPAGSGSVYVTDVNALLTGGKAPARPMPREAFETAAMAQLPPGASSPRAAPGADHATPPPGVDGGAPVSPPGKAVVTIYGTSWCGACRQARAYFAERKIPFADKDIEQDPVAARELGEKAAKMGIPTDRVPVLDVRGRLLLGFDRARVEALLGDPT